MCDDLFTFRLGNRSDEEYKPVMIGPLRVWAKKDSSGNLAALVAITLSVVGLYAQVLDNFFLNDDFGRIYAVKGIERLGPFNAVLSLFTEQHHAYFRPLTFLVFYLLNVFFGLDPWYYYLSAIGFHIISALLVYWVVREIADETGPHRVWFALLVALLFAVHPRQVESVSYIHDNENTICGMFFLVGIWCFIWFHRTQRTRYLLGACVSYLFSLFGKEMAITLPLISLLYFFTYEDRRDLLSLLSSKIMQSAVFAYGTVTIGYFFLRYHVLGTIVGGAGETSKLAFSVTRIARTLVQACCAMVLPNDIPGVDFLGDLFRPHPLVFVLIGAAVAAIAFLQLPRPFTNRFRFGLMWCLISLLPIINNGIGVHELTGGRYLYLPLMGFSICIADMLYRINGRRTMFGATLFILVFLSAFSYRNNTMIDYSSRISESFLRGLSETISDSGNERVALLVPSMFKGMYMLNGMTPGILLYYGEPGARFLERVSELNLQISREGEIDIRMDPQEDRAIQISIGEGAGFLWLEGFFDKRLFSQLGLSFDAARPINTRGDFVAQVARLSNVERIVLPDFQGNGVRSFLLPHRL